VTERALHATIGAVTHVSLAAPPVAGTGRVSRTPALARARDVGLVVLAILAAALGARAFRDYVFEDAYITYRYAENIAAGRGFAFNPGERVLGTTTPLYSLILAGAGRLGLDIPTAGTVLSCLSLAAAALCGAWILWRHAHPGLAVLHAVALLWGVGGMYVFTGMETAFYSLLLHAAAIAALRQKPVVCGALVGLACVTRYDAVVFAGVLLALWWLGKRRLPVDERRDRGRAARALAPVRHVLLRLPPPECPGREERRHARAHVSRHVRGNDGAGPLPAAPRPEGQTGVARARGAGGGAPVGADPLRRACSPSPRAAAARARAPPAPPLAFAARSARFLAARSPSTWTLPAQASLLTGLWPPQHGAERNDAGLARELETLPEVFARAGYRTAAITDGLFVTARREMAQGFESFRECVGQTHWSLARTLANAEELALADDGRPLFLFVHTYRTHAPYRTGTEEDGARFRELARLSKAEDGGVLTPEVAARHLDEVRALYREGARAFDAQFGPWFAELERHGLFRNGLFVFTSDHGEAFLEHGDILHEGAPFEELTRIPLFVFGNGVQPRDVRLGASLVDLAPTLAARCGIERGASWAGADLLALRAERMLFSCVLNDDRRQLAVVRGNLKLHAAAAPEVELPRDATAAFDLAADPAERFDLRDRAAWPRELADVAASAWSTIRAPLVPAAILHLDPEAIHELRDLGYGR
jgi:arylsulfatase A-like enzyme